MLTLNSCVASVVATLLASITAAQTYPASDITASPVVDLGYVKYQGYTNHTAGISYYRGIPFAQPPTGDLRWRAPRPIEAKNDFDGRLVNASTVAPFCYQGVPAVSYGDPLLAPYFGPLLNVPQSEDCLILDVLRPVTLSSDYVPVMVLIHAGGYNLGGASIFPGDAMVNRSNGDMLFVAIQYRLGLFGFLAGSEVMEDGTANAGLLDQRLALGWVQRNIRAFGGDPSRVTLIGGSGGGGSITHQLAAYGGSGTPPFSAAIPEYPWVQPLLDKSSQEIQFRNTLTVSNCASLACLRGLPESQLATVNQAVQNYSRSILSPGLGFGDFYFGPVIDGDFVRDLPSSSFNTGKFYKVPLLIDHDAYEGYIFSNITETSVVAESLDAEVLFPTANPSFFSRLYSYYPRTDYNSTFFQRQTWFGDFIINCPTYYIASNAVDFLGNSSQVWKLIFAAGNQLHAATQPFLASDTTDFYLADNKTLAEYMSHWFISFAVHQDPNVGAYHGAPEWPSYVSGGDESYGVPGVGFTTLHVTEDDIETFRDPDASGKCDFFGSRRDVVRN